jgi:hypothetical protein
VKFTPKIGTDTTAPQVVSTSPENGAIDVNINSFITATFSKLVDSTTVTNATFILTDPSSTVVPATISYSKKTRTATLIPNAPLDYSTTYTGTVKGGLTDPRIKDTLAKLYLQTTYGFYNNRSTRTTPDEGTGARLIISSAANPFSRYPVEILRAQGYNEFLARTYRTHTNSARQF